MIKKYRNIILTNASIIGFGLNNVKADPNNGKLTIKIDGKDYTLDANKIETVANKQSIDALLTALDGKKDDIKDNENKKVAGDITKELYFVKSILPVGKSTNEEIKIGDDFSIKLTEDKQAKIELVKKEDRINITYDADVNGGELTKENEEKILDNILQGVTIGGMCTALNLEGLGFTFGGENKDDKTIGTDINLFANNDKIEFKITKLPDVGFKTVVCKFAEGVEELLVEGIDLESFCTNVDNDSLKNKTYAEIFQELQNSQFTDKKIDKFFKDNAVLKINCNGNKDIKGSVQTDNNDGNFIIIKDIKEENINPIFLKKKFSVQFDNTGADKKTVKSEILKKIEGKLNEKFKDEVEIYVKSIIDVIYGVDNGSGTKFIDDNKIDDLTNISFEGVNLVTTPLLDFSTSFVDKKDIIIKLKEGAFRAGIVEDVINLTFKTDNIKKDSRKLKDNIKSNITTTVSGINTKTTKAAFVKTFNSIQGLEMTNNNNGLVESDFNFTNVLAGNEIGKNGEIALNDSGIKKIADSCFEDAPKPKPKTNNSTGDSVSGDSDDQNKKNDGYSCNKKKNK